MKTPLPGFAVAVVVKDIPEGLRLPYTPCDVTASTPLFDPLSMLMDTMGYLLCLSVEPLCFLICWLRQ